MLELYVVRGWVQLLYDSGSSSAGWFLFSSESGPGAAVSGMRHEINSGYSCYITAALTTQNSKKRLLKHNGMAMEFLKASLL